MNQVDLDSDHPVPSVLALRNVNKSYREGNVQALRNVCVDIPAGAFVSIMGPSGCGKSTLLHMLGALDRPDSGEVLFRGKPLDQSQNLDRFRAQQIGFVFQSFYLLPNLTAAENVQLPMFESRLSLADRSTRARSLLKEVGLEDRLNHLPSQLSNGQRQRVAIARAIANQPAVLLADEPTGALDSRSGQEVMELLGRLNQSQGMTLIVVTHDLSVAKRAGMQLMMLDGRFVDHPTDAALAK